MTWHDLAARPDEAGDLKYAPDPAKLDLHSLWAGASRFAGYKDLRDQLGRRMAPVMLEIDPAATLAERQLIWTFAQTPLAYRTPASRFVTGLVPISDLYVLGVLPRLLRWRIGAPQIARQDPRESPIDLGGYTLPDGVPWIGIIDHGFAFAHAAFRHPALAGSTRILALWDQEPGRTLPRNNPLGQWLTPGRLGYGGYITGTQIDAELTGSGGDELRVYRNFAYTPAQRRVSHGTHVLDLAAGYPHPLAPRGAPFDRWDGCAAIAPIIAVQLPYRPNKDTSGSGLGVQVLDALHFIAACVPARRRVVINLSDGAYGGRHDGTSMTEAAIDDFLRKHPRVELVLAAGNAGNQALHARGQTPLGPGDVQGVDWMVLPDDSTDNFCEIWFDPDPAAGSVELSLQPPQGLPAVTVALGQSRVWRLASSPYAQAAVLSTVDSVNHRGRRGFLVALGPTRWGSHRGPGVPHGCWRLQVRNVSSAASPMVRFWVERDDPVGNEAGPRRQSRLQARAGGGVVVATERTLASLAGSAEAFVVGGYGRRGLWPTGPGASPRSDVPPYVSRGPGRAGGAGHQIPDVQAPCEDSPSLHGLLAASNRSGTRFRMDGTSVAAPQVTRRLVNLIAATNPSPPRAALRSLLSSGNRRVVPGEEPAGGPCQPAAE